LQLKNIYKSYITGGNKQIALDGINLKFRESEFVTILGPSGSGKTTCLNIIGGLEHYDKGDLIINGRSTKDFSDSDWDSYRNNTVGFIFKNYNLIPHLSILENVQVAISLTDLSKEEKQKKAIDALDKVGIKDYMRKTSEFLSRDEMQRVAIARALVNDPNIILADEPTGNLDSKSSLEIIDLMKEVFKDKLVIVVTQNEQIAKSYATRVISFRDGEIVYDSDPLKEDLHQRDISLKKTSMGVCMALKLAARDMSNKKMRTFIYMLISSVGIIGIAIVISLITGFEQKINDYEKNTLADFPIVIDDVYDNLDIYTQIGEIKNIQKYNDKFELYTSEEVVYPYDWEANNKSHKNKITDEYVRYIKNMDSDLFSAISYKSQIDMNILKKDDKGRVSILDTSAINFSSYPEGNGEEKYLEQNYDLLYGYYPTDKKDIVLVVDEYNRVDSGILKALGVDCDREENVKFDELIGKEYKIILNDEFYKKEGKYFTTDISDKNLENLYNSKKSLTISITGILRAKKDNNLSYLSQGIAYSNELSSYYINNCKKSKIVDEQQKSNYNVITGQRFEGDKQQALNLLGASSVPSSITIYPKDFESKRDILGYLNKYNEGKGEGETILYEDTSTIINQVSSNIMKCITMVLVSFICLAMITSLITMFVITYIAVLERKHEISILRVLGARRRDIVRMFNVENAVIGFLAGVLGVFIAYIFIIPLNNYMLKTTTELSNIAILRPKYAVLLIITSIVITLIGGFIPAKIASKKDPVEFLKSK
ncbi:MAG: ATP-binding cassette domain-containing protein, partial [Intestinibacter sp.]|uniref:ABC transporter ATP-binding protein/permease n=1 Tax=Intestinibacter sp. TaxID=1965304 RepID=UPI002A820252